MSQINVSSDDKQWFDSFKGDRNQGEAFAEMVQIVKTFNGEAPDEESIAELTAEKMGPKLELILYRVAEEMEGDDE